MKGKKGLVKKGAYYSAGTILINSLNLLSVPIFTRIMLTSYYGEYNVFLSYANIFFVFVGFAIHASLNTAKFDFREEYDKYLKSCVTFILLCYLGYVFISIAVYQIGHTILGYHFFILQCLLIRSLSIALSNFYSSKCIMNYEYKKQLIVSFLNVFIDMFIGVVIVSVIRQDWQFEGRVFANALAALTNCGIVSFVFLRDGFSIKKRFLSYALKISMPVVPHGISQIILSSFDRIMIKSIIGPAAAGVYSLSYTIGSVLSVIVNSLSGIWSPWFYEKMNENKADVINKKSILYIGAISFLSMNAILLSPEGIIILAPVEYYDAKYFTPIVLLGIYFSLLYMLPASIEYYYKKTGYIAFGTMSAALINIILNEIFICKYGYMAASYTTLVTYVLYFLFHIVVYKRLEKNRVFSRSAFVLCIIGVLVVALITIVFVNYLIIRMCILLILDIPVFIYGFKFYVSEKNNVL